MRLVAADYWVFLKFHPGCNVNIISNTHANMRAADSTKNMVKYIAKIYAQLARYNIGSMSGD